ncbi:zingipain-2-like [Daphnia pulex]|uniref:zingipain-2-like n=1 Tax=Daphnia pulex TaxID=6669 RepID=UPI001EDD8109|nr:zingipain-2-like [Daphnia pulex]
MGKFTFVAVIVMMALAARLHAAEDFESVWQAYLSEHEVRKSIFNETHARTKKHNSKKGVTFQMGHIAFSVLTSEEKKRHLGALKPVRPNSVVRGVARQALPCSIDYRTDSCLPPVESIVLRDQGGCGSSWAHSATAVVEFGKCKKCDGTALDLRLIVDCSREEGCSGGWEQEAWQYLASNGGQTDDSSYPYTTETRTCVFIPSDMSIGAEISSSDPVEWVAWQDPTAMMTVLAGGRIISIFMQLPESFFSYEKYLLDAFFLSRSYAHAMNVVGYGTLDQNDYWVVRYSWSEGWEAAGYVLVRRSVDLCMIE